MDQAAYCCSLIRIFRNGIQMHGVVFLRIFFRRVLLIFFAFFFHVDMHMIFTMLEMDSCKVFGFPECVREKIGNSRNQRLDQRQRVAEEEQYGHLFFHTLIYGDWGAAGLLIRRKKRPFNGPVQCDERNNGGNGNNDPLFVPGLFRKPHAHQQPGDEDHGNLS